MVSVLAPVGSGRELLRPVFSVTEPEGSKAEGTSHSES